VIVVNTCTVTRARGTRRRASWWRRLHRESPGARIVVTGMLRPSAHRRSFGALAGVFGRFSALPRREGSGHRCEAGPWAVFAVDVGPGRAARAFAHIRAGSTSGAPARYSRSRDGCDSFCTYCVVPYVRGAEPEPVLRGGSWTERGGSSTRDSPRSCSPGPILGATPRLSNLVGRDSIAGAGAPRPPLLDRAPQGGPPRSPAMIGAEPRLCRHLHLPLQSGSKRDPSRDAPRVYAGGLRPAPWSASYARGPVGIGGGRHRGVPGRKGEAEFQGDPSLPGRAARDLPARLPVFLASGHGPPRGSRSWSRDPVGAREAARSGSASWARRRRGPSADRSSARHSPS